MPELPEVETTRRGIESYIIHQAVSQIIIRNHQLRWPITSTLRKEMLGQQIQRVIRRGKYLLLECEHGTLIIHLGMSGSLCILTTQQPPKKHDHVDIIFANGICLRFTDPRRFGCLLWTLEDPLHHPLLKSLGPEPLTPNFNSQHLFLNSRRRGIPIKNFIMDGKVVVGVGNIYANEALFMAGIHPERSAKDIPPEEYVHLTQAIKTVLKAAVKQGGTTLRNFTKGDGQPGYFKQHLQVYGRGGLACRVCKTILTEIQLGQRATVFCIQCQKK